MAVLVNIWLKAEQLEKLADGLKAKGEKGIAATVAVNDEVNEWGQNAAIYIDPQDKEKKRFYFGNGKATWHNGKLVVVKYDGGRDVAHEYAITGGADTPVVEVKQDDNDDLPF
jgi:hypothetical protein